MSSASKRKGTAAETLVVRWLQDHGFRHAERRALAGVNDKGDVTGLGPLVIEVKDRKEQNLSVFLHELRAEIANAKADTGAVFLKRRGTLDVGEWYAILPVRDLVRVWREAGYGEPLA